MISGREFISSGRDRMNCVMLTVKCSSSVKDKINVWMEPSIKEKQGTLEVSFHFRDHK